MANILDYLDWRGDLTLSERAFNEVDNLILAEICYLDLSGFAPAGFETQQVTLREAWDAYFAAHPTTDMGVLVPDQIPGAGSKGSTDRTLWQSPPARLCEPD